MKKLVLVISFKDCRTLVSSVCY